MRDGLESSVVAVLLVGLMLAFGAGLGLAFDFGPQVLLRLAALAGAALALGAAHRLLRYP